jgi:hypothetical protein
MKKMKIQKYIYWQDDDMWLGYLEEYPDYWTQGETIEELRENLRDIYNELNSNSIPCVRRVDDFVAVITSMSARIYGRRNAKKKLRKSNNV